MPALGRSSVQFHLMLSASATVGRNLERQMERRMPSVDGSDGRRRSPRDPRAPRFTSAVAVAGAYSGEGPPALCRYVMRPRERSYGESSRVTRSPTSTRILYFDILPAA